MTLDALWKDLQYDVRTTPAPQCASILPSERDAACRRNYPIPVNRHSPSARWRQAHVDSISKQVQVHQSGNHVEFVVEPAYGLIVLVCQTCVSLESSDGILYAHPGGVDHVAVLFLLGSQAPVL